MIQAVTPDVSQTPSIRPQQLDLLSYLASFQFLSTSQLQHLFYHSDSRRIRIWLQNLLDKGYIQKINHVESAYLRLPTLYHLLPLAREKLIKNKKHSRRSLRWLAKMPSLSRDYQLRQLRITDYFLFLRTKTKSSHEKLRFFTRPDMFGYDFFPRPLPDAFYTITNQQNSTTHYFLETLDMFTSQFMLKKVIDKYIDFYEEDMWTENTMRLQKDSV